MAKLPSFSPSKIGRYIENRCHMGSSKTHNEIYHLQTKLLQCAPNEVPTYTYLVFEQELRVLTSALKMKGVIA